MTPPNLYWPVYQNLERSVEEMTFAIHFDDDQLDVYSSEIIDLILRAAAEVESLAKELYILNGGPETERRKIVFDRDAMTHLNDLWVLDAKVVLLSCPSMFQTVRELTPFAFNSKNRWGDSWEWNTISYQALKHDRAASMKQGSVRHLIDIMAALFVLNLYYRDETYELDKDAHGNGLPTGLGSRLFGIRIHTASHDGLANYRRQDHFDECTYVIDHTPEGHKAFAEATNAMVEANRKLGTEHPKVLAAIVEAARQSPDDREALVSAARGALTTEERSDLVLQAARSSGINAAMKQLRWRALPNKHTL